jgi:hypothetical protein
MDHRMFAVFIVLTIELLAIWRLWPGFLSMHLVVETSALQQTALQYLGMPILAGVVILMLASFLNTLVTGQQATQFLDDLFRFAMVTTLLCIGTNGGLHALFVWPHGKPGEKINPFHFLALLPSLLFLVLGAILLVRFFQFS